MPVLGFGVFMIMDYGFLGCRVLRGCGWQSTQPIEAGVGIENLVEILRAKV